MPLDRYFDPDNPNSKQGDRSTGPAAGQPATPTQRVTYDPTIIGGGKAVVQDNNDGSPEFNTGANPADVERDHYRDIGDSMSKRGAYQLQFGAANQDRAANLQARESQVGANTLLQGAAHGNAPSSAAINAGQSAGLTLEGQLAASAGARAPQAASAQAGAASAAPNAQLQSVNAAGYGRSAEINNALTNYGASSKAMRSGDSTLQQEDQRQAEAQAQQEMAQRARNLGGQMGMEQLGINTEQDQVNASNRLANIQNKANQDTTAANLNDQKRATQTYTDLSNLVTSDKRMKEPATLEDSIDWDYRKKEGERPAASGATWDANRKAPSGPQLKSLEQKGNKLEAEIRGQEDSLRFGSSVERGKDRADSDDANNVDEADVNTIKYGSAPYDRSMYASSNPQNLHQGMERSLARDRALQQAREDMAEDMARPNHAGNPRGYDLGTGYSADPAGRDPWSRPSGPDAPGTSDYLQYGKPRKVDRVVPGSEGYIKGMEPHEKVDAPMDDYSKAVSLSDQTAKQPARLTPEEARANAARRQASEEWQRKSTRDTALSGSAHLAYGQFAAGAPRVLSATYSMVEDKANHAVNERANAADRARVRHDEAEHYVKPEDEKPEDATSDERSKNKQKTTRSTIGKTPQTEGYAKNKGAGQGEEEHGGTTYEHRGSGATEETAETKSAGQTKRGVKGGGESVDSTNTATVSRTMASNPLGLDNVEPHRSLQQDANRKLVGSTYTYKDGFGEDPNQIHHGQMAQTMEENPITATAVREDPTGIKKVNEFDKLNVTAAGVAELQQQHDELAAELEKLSARRQRKRA